jgi:hypothetical protein
VPGPTGATGATGATGPAGADGSPDTAAQVLTKLLTVDGTGSGLDADLLDGQHATAFATPASLAAAVATHEADTTAVHGIADTSLLVLTGDGRLTDARTPSGAASGVLAGTYPSPSFAADMATQAELDAHVIATGAHAATKITNTPAGGIAATTVQAALDELDAEKLAKASNLSDLASVVTARTNLGLGSAALSASTAFEVAGTALLKTSNLSDLASAGTARTNLGLGGAALLAVGTTAGTVAAGNDGRLTDARTPTAHATSHASAGSDPLTLAQSQITGLATTLATYLPLAGGTLSGTLTIGGAFVAIGTTPATTGIVRLPNNKYITWWDTINAVTYGGIGLNTNVLELKVPVGGYIALGFGLAVLDTQVNFTDIPMQFGTVTGTKLGMAANQKLAFYGATPIVRPTSTPAAATDLATALTLVNDIRVKLLALGLIA